MTIKGLLTKAEFLKAPPLDDGPSEEVELEWNLRRSSSGEIWFWLKGGPTGHESIPVDSLMTAAEKGGWLACFGSIDRYDKLLVPDIECARVFTEIMIFDRREL